MLLVAAAICASVAAGVGAERRWGSAAQAATRRLLDALLYGLLPFIVFFLIARLEITPGVGAGLLLAYAELAVVGLLAWLAGARVLRLPAPSTGALVCAVILANTGFLGLPLNAVLLGGEALGPAIAFDTLVSAPMLLVSGFAVGAAFGTAAGQGARRRLRAFVLRNPPLVAVALALVAPDALAPEALVTVARGVAVGLLPIGFFVLGVTLAAEAEVGRLRIPPPLTAPVATAVGLRMVAAPALLAAFSAVTVRVPDAYLLQAAMPCGINTLVVAHAYGLDLRLASGAVAWSTAVAVVAGLASSVL